jgi:lipopolysaccharide transport system permease protein
MKPSTWNPLSPLLVLIQHQALLRQFARRLIEQRHRGSFLGLAWTVISPLLSLAIYTFVFGFVFQGRFTDSPDETNLDYALGIFLGLVLFNFLGEVLSQSSSAIVNQPNLVKKVVFPLEILPAAAVASALVTAGITLTLALAGVVVFGDGLDGHAFLLLLILPPIGLIALGCAWFFAALGVFVRDISSAMPFFVQILVYLSAVFYPLRLLEKAPPLLQNVVLANPLLHAVESTRRAVLWHQAVEPSTLGMLWVTGLVVCVAGYAVFHKLRPAFADVL